MSEVPLYFASTSRGIHSITITPDGTDWTEITWNTFDNITSYIQRHAKRADKLGFLKRTNAHISNARSPRRACVQDFSLPPI